MERRASPRRADPDPSPETGAVLRTASGPDGRYQFAEIPVGVCEVTVAMPCCGFDPYRRDVTIHAGQATAFDISLMENVGGKTLGDDPGRADALRAHAVVPDLPVPMINGVRDLSGVWLIYRDRYPEARGAAMGGRHCEGADCKQQEGRASYAVPAGRFSGAGASTPFITKFVQTPALLMMLFEDVPASVRCSSTVAATRQTSTQPGSVTPWADGKPTR